MARIYRPAPGSLVPVSLAHFAFNFGLNLAGPQGLGLAPALPLLAGLAGLTFLVELVVWATGGLSAEK